MVSLFYRSGLWHCSSVKQSTLEIAVYLSGTILCGNVAFSVDFKLASLPDHMPCWWGLEYTEYISCRRVKLPSPKKKGVSWVWHETVLDG